MRLRRNNSMSSVFYFILTKVQYMEPKELFMILAQSNNDASESSFMAPTAGVLTLSGDLQGDEGDSPIGTAGGICAPEQHLSDRVWIFTYLFHRCHLWGRVEIQQRMESKSSRRDFERTKVSWCLRIGAATDRSIQARCKIIRCMNTLTGSTLLGLFGSAHSL